MLCIVSFMITNSLNPKSSASHANDENDKFESTWRTPESGNEAIKISQTLSKNGISCPEILVKRATGETSYYLCACRVNSAPWTIYQLWSSSQNVLRVNDPSLKTP